MLILSIFGFLSHINQKWSSIIGIHTLRGEEVIEWVTDISSIIAQAN